MRRAPQPRSYDGHQQPPNVNSDFIKATFEEIRDLMMGFINRFDRLEEANIRTASEGARSHAQGQNDATNLARDGTRGSNGPIEAGLYGRDILSSSDDLVKGLSSGSKPGL